MFRNAPRAALRAQKHISSSLAPSRTAARRYLTTEPPHKTSRSWKNAGLRWGIAVAGIYYYNTSPVFAEHPQHNLLNPNLDAIDDEHDNQTIDRLLQSSKSKQHKQKSALQSAVETSSEKAAEQTEQKAQDARQDVAQSVAVAEPATEGAAELEAEAEGEGAFNPVTGEINWDCPCLGGMAYGPCGEEFRAAFSCFVYSNEEPKGMECIEKFGAMQDCFRAHPEVYQSELEDDETLDGELAAEKEELQKELAERREQVQNRLHESKQTDSSDAPAEPSKTRSQTPDKYSSDNEAKRGSASQPIKKPTAKETSKDAKPESEQLVPKAAHDAVETSKSSTRSVTRNA